MREQITNDPKQRPMVGSWAAVFKSIFSGTFSMILAATLMPKHGHQKERCPERSKLSERATPEPILFGSGILREEGVL